MSKKSVSQLAFKNAHTYPMFRTPYNFILNTRDMEANTGLSLTIPGQSYTVREILEKFTRGLAPRVSKNGVFEEDPSFDTIDATQSPDFDLTDATTLLHQSLTALSESKAAQKTAMEAKEAIAKAKEDKQSEDDKAQAKASKLLEQALRNSRSRENT